MKIVLWAYPTPYLSFKPLNNKQTNWDKQNRTLGHVFEVRKALHEHLS